MPLTHLLLDTTAYSHLASREKLAMMRLFSLTAFAGLSAALRAPLGHRSASLASALRAPSTVMSASDGIAKNRVVLVAGAGCLTGRSVCNELRRAPGVDLAALAPEELFLATNDDGRTLAADARPFAGGSVDALVIATDEAPDAQDVASLVSAAA